MVGTIKTVYLGCADKVSEKGNAYKVLSFLDGGAPVSCMLSSEYKGKLPNTLAECEMTLRVNLGRYMKAEVVDIKEL